MEFVRLINDDGSEEGFNIPSLPDGSRYFLLVRDTSEERQVWKRWPDPEGSEFHLAGRGGKDAHPPFGAEPYHLSDADRA